jgi:hypothetical protein
VTPIAGFSVSGPVGGPFSPPSQQYTVQNAGTLTMNWTAAVTQPWVSMTQTGGSLPGGATANVTVSMTGAASMLGAGTYADTVTFTNTTNGNGNRALPVSLTVSSDPPPSLLFREPPATVTQSPLIVSGTASDNGGIQGISWSNITTGVSGVGYGTTNWSVSVSLQPGANVVSIKALDDAGNGTTRSFQVTYAPVQPGRAVDMARHKRCGSTGVELMMAPLLLMLGRRLMRKR